MTSVNEYGDLHRATIQTLMAYGTIEKKLLEKILVQLAHKFLPAVERVNLDHIIEMINEKIARFDQKISAYEYGLTKEHFYVFHTTAVTSTSKMQSTFNENELDYFKALLSKIIENENLRIAPREALNLSSDVAGKINKLRAQKLLEIWIGNHYFFKHTDNRIYLGAKVLTEFKDYLQGKELDSLKSCILCESISIWGPRCVDCDVIFHETCLAKYRARSDKCPSCRSQFPDQAIPEDSSSE